MYIYKRSEPRLWTVGAYAPEGAWIPESDHSSPDEAAKRVHFLNGGASLSSLEAENKLLRQQIDDLRRQVDSLTTTFCYAPNVETWPRYEELKQVMADKVNQ
jgi:hypothetical protein